MGVAGLLLSLSLAFAEAAGALEDPAGTCLLRARVVASEGAPVAVARLALRSRTTTGRGGEKQGLLAETDPDGRVRLALPRDLYGWSVASRRHPTTAERTVDLTRSCAGAALGEIALAPGAPMAGRVVGPDDAPLAGARVRISSDPDTPPYLWVLDGHVVRPHRETTTGPEGRFRLPGLVPEARYTVWAEAPGFRPAQVEAEAPTDSVRIELDPAARLAVEVVDPEGRGIEGVDVDLRRLGDAQAFGAIRETRVTDVRGHYEADAREPGATAVEIRAPGYEHARRVVELVEGESRNERFVLSPVPSSPVELRTVDEDGEPISEVQAWIHSAPGTPDGTHLPGESDEAGRVVWPRIPHGRYRVSFQAPRTVPAERPDDLDLEVGAAPVVREIVLRRPPGRPVEGRVVDPDGGGVPGVEVTVHAQGSFETSTGPEGRFRFDHLPYGEHSVYLREPGVAGVRSRTARVGEEPEPWSFEVPAGTEVRGRLVPGPGVEPEGPWKITARREGSSGHAVGWLEGDLRYRFPRLTPGTWTLEAENGAAKGRAVVELGAGDPPRTRNIAVEALDDGFVITGTLRHRGEALAGARVGLEQRERPFQRYSTTTDAAGRFEIGDVPAGTYTWAVWHGAPVLRRQVTLDGPADLSRELDFAWVRGRVEVDGVDPSTLTVRLQPHGPDDPDAGWSYVTHTYPQWAQPRSDGTFHVGPLEEGRWSFELQVPGHTKLRREVVIAGRDVEDLVLAPEPSPGLTVRLVTVSGTLPEHVSLQFRPKGSDKSERPLRNFFTLTGPTVHWDAVPPDRGLLTVDTQYVEVGPIPVEVPGPPVEVEVPPRGKLELRAPLLPRAEAEEAVLTLRPMGPEGGKARTRSFGRVVQGVPPRTFETLPPGVYRITLEIAGGRAWTEVVEIRDHETTRVVLQ